MPTFLKMFTLIISLFCLFQNSHSQIVKFVKNDVSAQHRVFITKTPSEATHFIYRVSNPSEIRKPGHWYVVQNPTLFKQSVTLFEVKTKEEADIIVFYVSHKDSSFIRIRR